MKTGICSDPIAELVDRGKDFSAKDLVSSVFNAANKKIRRREKTKGESIDVDPDSESNYQERNIDVEIENRIGRVATEGPNMVAGTTAAHSVTHMTSSSEQRDVRASMRRSSSGQRIEEGVHVQQQQQQQYSSRQQYSTQSVVGGSAASGATAVTHTRRQDMFNAKLAYLHGSDSKVKAGSVDSALGFVAKPLQSAFGSVDGGKSRAVTSATDSHRAAGHGDVRYGVDRSADTRQQRLPQQQQQQQYPPSQAAYANRSHTSPSHSVQVQISIDTFTAMSFTYSYIVWRAIY